MSRIGEAETFPPQLRLVDPVPSTMDEATEIDLAVRAALTSPIPLDLVGSAAIAVGIFADPAFNPVLRDCETTGCLPAHEKVGGNAWIPELFQNPDWKPSAEQDAVPLYEKKCVAPNRAANGISRPERSPAAG